MAPPIYLAGKLPLEYIQRAQFLGGDGPSLDDYFRWEYMGSSEFEGGTLPRSIAGMRLFDQKKGLQAAPLVVRGKVVYFVGPAGRLDDAAQLVDEELGPRRVSRKEITRMKQTILEPETYPDWMKPTQLWVAVVKWPKEKIPRFSATECPFVIAATEEVQKKFLEGLRHRKVGEGPRKPVRSIRPGAES
jgi:hypothetical protein